MSLADHKAHAPTPASVRVGVITVSDTRTLENDTSGGYIADRMAEAGHRLAARTIVIDSELQIRAHASGGRVAPEKRRYEPTGHVRPERRCSRYVKASTTNENASRSAAVRPARA